MKYNQTTLDRTQKILEEAGYVVRFEKGTFQSGYCILEAKKVVVLNKFLSLEGRINTLMDIIASLSIGEVAFTPDTRKAYEEIIARLATESHE